jgi:hypothetical protein
VLLACELARNENRGKLAGSPLGSLRKPGVVFKEQNAKTLLVMMLEILDTP